MSGLKPAEPKPLPKADPCIQLTRDGLHIMGRPRELMAILKDLSRSYDRLAELLRRTTH